MDEQGSSEQLTESLEMYLEVISRLRERCRVARVTDIASELGVTKPSVHAALHELGRRGLVEHEHYGEVRLSAEGQAAGADVRRRHETLAAFLRDILGVSPLTAEADACRIEHYLSEETLLRIEASLAAATSAAAPPAPVSTAPASGPAGEA